MYNNICIVIKMRFSAGQSIRFIYIAYINKITLEGGVNILEYIISAGIGVAVAVIICLVVALVTNTKRKNAVAMINSAKD